MTVLDEARILVQYFHSGWSLWALAFHYDRLPETIEDILRAWHKMPDKRS